MKQSILVALVICCATAISLRANHTNPAQLWLSLLLPYVGLTAWSLALLHKKDLLIAMLRPKAGDLTIGFALAALLVGAAVICTGALVPPGSAAQRWFFELYALVGNVRGELSLTIAVVAIAIMEELTWRGLVVQLLRPRVARRWVVPVSAVLYSLAHVPTVVTLGVDGPNPLLVAGALVCGLFWGYTAQWLGRLTPVALSHALFSYYMSSPSAIW